MEHKSAEPPIVETSDKQVGKEASGNGSGGSDESEPAESITAGWRKGAAPRCGSIKAPEEKSSGNSSTKEETVLSIELMVFGGSDKGRRGIGESNVEGEVGEAPPEADSKQNFSFKYL